MLNKKSHIAYIDGSHHFKSKTSGWGFIVEKDGILYKESFGQVPNEWLLDFENYAFAKLIEFCLEEKITDIHIFTDYLNLPKKFNNFPSVYAIELACKYLPHLSKDEINISFEHIHRNKNKMADRYSREYLKICWNEEKSFFESEYKNNRFNGKPKHPKLSFFRATQQLYASKTMSRSAERKVLYAIKHDYLIIELGFNKKTKQDFIKVMTFKRKHYKLIEELILDKNTEAQSVLSLLEKYTHTHPYLLLAITPSKQWLFNQMIGLDDNALGQDINMRLENVLDKIDDLFIYDRSFTRNENQKEINARKKNQVKLMSMEEKIIFYQEKAKTNEKAFQKIIGWDIKDFRMTNNRIPTALEIEVLVKKRKEVFSM